MKFIIATKKTIARISFIAALLMTVTAAAFGQTPVEEIQPPVVPCSQLQVEAGNKVSSHVYAVGVQIYRWNGQAWDFVGPVANLYADANFHGKVGIHYGGPTWESNSGSKVVAARAGGCTPDANAIPWLLLRKVTAEGPGIFDNVTFIQRVNTTGGLKPTAPGTTVGAEQRVPYTAEYYFYRAQD